MAVYQLNFKLEFDHPLDEVWDVVTKCSFVQEVLPESLTILNTDVEALPEYLYDGMLVKYNFKYKFFSQNWIFEVTEMKNKRYLKQEHRLGSFQFFHFDTVFESRIGGGCILYDQVTYRMKMGVLGRMYNHFYVKPKIPKVYEKKKNCIDKILAESHF